MLKKIAVLAMTLASFGAVLPATAAAAERRIENRVVVHKEVVHRHNRIANRRVVVRHARGRKVVIVKHA